MRSIGHEPRPDDEAISRLKKFGDDSQDMRSTLNIFQLILDEWVGPKTPWSALKGKKFWNLLQDL